MMRFTQADRGNEAGPPGRPGKYPKILAALVVALLACLALGSMTVYQQFQIANLSSSLAQQSSEFANPTSSVAISNFTVTKLNATAKPVLFLIFLNNGTSPASNLENLIVGVYGTNGSFESCYNDTQSYFPLFSNESVMVISRLTCGEIGDTVVLTATVDFLTSHGSVAKAYSARTTISQSQFSIPSQVVVDHIGIKTYVVSEIVGKGTYYDWKLYVTNYSPTPIISLNETALTGHGASFSHEGCLFFRIGGPYGVSQNNPLPPGSTCQIDNNIPLSLGPFELGEHLQVVVGIKYLNGTSSAVTTTAMVIPLYALLG